MEYRQPAFVSREVTVHTARTGSPADACEALIGAALAAPDPSWVEALCLDLARSAPDPEVRAAAALAFAHLARRFGRLDDRPSVEATLDHLDHDPAVRGRIADVRDDLATYLDG